MFFGKKKSDHLSNKVISLAKKGDKKAFGEIYDHFVKSIFRFMYFKTGKKEIAEDLTQNLFLKAFEAISSFEGKGNIGAWLFSIARNLVADHYRYQKETLRIEYVAEVETTDNNRESEKNQALIDFISTLSRLDEEEQEVIILHSVEGYSFEEIAKITNKSAGALRTLKHRAIKKLKDSYGK
jgi:RNA polymerase sigma-70 factor (ECF subfamily)